MFMRKRGKIGIIAAVFHHTEYDIFGRRMGKSANTYVVQMENSIIRNVHEKNRDTKYKVGDVVRVSIFGHITKDAKQNRYQEDSQPACE